MDDPLDNEANWHATDVPGICEFKQDEDEERWHRVFLTWCNTHVFRDKWGDG